MISTPNLAGVQCDNERLALLL